MVDIVTWDNYPTWHKGPESHTAIDVYKRQAMSIIVLIMVAILAVIQMKVGDER